MVDRSMLMGVLVASALFGAASACAQTSPPANPAVPQTPNAETPPGGVARGVVPPPTVDPGMVTAPPQPSTQTMPVITPPPTAK